MSPFCPAHLPAKPKIHCRRGKEQRRERRIPRAVKDVASDYEKILPRIPGMYAPIGGNDGCKKDDERERIEKHGGRTIAYLRRHADGQYILSDHFACPPRQGQDRDKDVESVRLENYTGQRLQTVKPVCVAPGRDQ